MQGTQKVAMVTGGGQGLGQATCKKLAEEGMRVVVCDFKVEQARQTAASITERGLHAHPLELDVRNHEQIQSGVHRILSEYGKIDVLVNNAGVDRTVSIQELTPEDWDNIMETNLRGPFLLSRAVLPAMSEQGAGHIINIISTAAKRCWPNASAYHASKWGLLGFSHALHTEARPQGVKVTAVICGGMRTPFLLDRFPDINVDTLQDPANVAEAIAQVLKMPRETTIPELMVLPMGETSWP
ncbi:SDR family oxidoreductase [Oligoflexus tunisiensis]|uniref:SDR family oxidoreductase n=1 Tax=Oligoflexus tunisiensis TaxID=708132 RepID=UPI000B2213B6|nr:SDR family oxidoreductase [Oligoflexus tunisiensis]